MQRQFEMVSPKLWRLLDRSPESGLTVSVKLIAGKSGLSVRNGVMTLGAHYGGFPAKSFGIEEQLAEASILAAKIDLNEPLWGNGVFKFVCIEAARELNHVAEALAEVKRIYRPALKLDPKFLHADLSKPEGIPAVLRNGKGLWLVQQLNVRYLDDFMIHYFRAKRRLVPAGHKLTADDVAALASYVAGTSQFPWFNFHGIKVKPSRTKIPLH